MNFNNNDKKNYFVFIERCNVLNNISKSKKLFVVFLLIAILFFATLIVYMLLQNNKCVNKILLSRESTLNEELTKVENNNDILEAEILLLKNEIKSLSKRNDKKKLQKITKYLADTEVHGKGVTIILNDNRSGMPTVDEENIIHNTDLLKIVNFLWENDATAVSINDERIVQNSNITCVGPTVLVNKKRVNTPFKIVAIGENLDENLVQNSTLVLSFKLRGLEVSVSENSDISVPPGKYTILTE